MNTRYVSSAFARATLNELVGKRRIRMCDIARACDLHDSTVERVVSGQRDKIERETAAKIEAGYEAIMSGKYRVERYRVGPIPRMGPPSERSQCIWGHPYTKRNTYIDVNGKRRCRICLAQRRAKWRAGVKARAIAEQPHM